MLATLIKFNLAIIFRKKKCHEFCQFAKKYGKWSIFELLVFQSPSPIAIDSYGGQMSDWSLEIEYRHYRLYVNYLRNWLWYLLKPLSIFERSISKDILIVITTIHICGNSCCSYQCIISICNIFYISDLHLRDSGHQLCN